LRGIILDNLVYYMLELKLRTLMIKQ